MWKRVKIRDIGKVYSGSTPRTTVKEFWEGTIVWVTPYDLSKLSSKYITDSERRITNEGLQNCSTHLLPKGAVVISSRAPIGYLGVADVKLCTNQGCKSIILNKDCSSDFLYYQLLHNTETVKRFGEGTTFHEIAKKFLEEIEVDVPTSLPEQTAIARILSTVDKAIEQTEQLIAKYQRIKTGLMQDLLTRGIDEHGRLRFEVTHRFKDSPLGRIPEEWEVVNLSSLGEILTGTTPSTIRQEYYGDDYFFITPSDIGENVFIIQTERKLSKLGFSVSRKVPGNAICTVCIGSTIGKIGLTSKESASNQQINILIPFDNERAYLYFCLMSLFLPKQLNIEAGLQAVPIVNKNTFSKLKVPLPGNEKEKNKIISAIYSLDLFLSKGKDNLSKLHSLKTALMQDLLSGRVRVPSYMIERIGEAGGVKTA